MRHQTSSTSEVYAALAASFFCSALAVNAEANEEKQGFNVTLKLLKPIVITQTTELSFESVDAGGKLQLITETSSPNAVKIVATGEPHAPIMASVVESRVILKTGEGLLPTEQVLVDSFTLGGDMSSNGITTFDAEGKIDNMRVGATAHVNEFNVPGNYLANATFRINYL